MGKRSLHESGIEPGLGVLGEKPEPLLPGRDVSLADVATIIHSPSGRLSYGRMTPWISSVSAELLEQGVERGLSFRGDFAGRSQPSP
jgi:hypothetical protein